MAAEFGPGKGLIYLKHLRFGVWILRKARLLPPFTACATGVLAQGHPAERGAGSAERTIKTLEQERTEQTETDEVQDSESEFCQTKPS